MSTIMRGKRQLQFHVVEFDQSGNVLPSKRPRFGSDGLDKRDGKENTIAATLCDRSYATHLQVQPQTYRFIAPRPAASHTSIQQSTLPCHSTNGLKNIREKLLESPKPVETPLKRSHEFPTTTSNRPMVDWIERVRTLNECEHLFRLKLLVLKSVYGSLSMAITAQYRKVICHGTIEG